MVNSIYSSHKEKCIIPLKSSATNGRFIFLHTIRKKIAYSCAFFLQENLLNSKICCNFVQNFEKEIENKSKIK